MNKAVEIFEALQVFIAAVAAKMAQQTAGEPEDQLRGPFENFMAQTARILGWDVVCTGETPLPEQLGRPDYAVHRNGLLTGYVELKAPGAGAAASRFRGHNREQFRRFSAIPNLIYTDGVEWALYRNGELVDSIVHLPCDFSTTGKRAATLENAEALERLLRDFLLWEPLLPFDSRGKIDLRRFAALLAPLCRMLRDGVADSLRDPDSPLVHLAKDWRQLLFPDASDDQFADAYAQTVTFALLLGRGEGAHPLTLERAREALAAQHTLLSRALQVLTDARAREGIAASLDLLLRVIAVAPPESLKGPEDPWLYFYEDFLAVYDPKLRKDAGAYYTPIEVVRCQVGLVEDLLVNQMGKPKGFADPDVITLDPAAGTGTYLLGVIEHTLGRVEAEQGKGAVAGQATALARNLYAFELMAGPYAVAELRVSRALRDHDAQLPADGIHVYLTDTLESPPAKPPQLPLILQPIAEQHAKALEVKSSVPVIVCLGNPPYDRHEAVLGDTKTGVTNLARTGGWIRWGDDARGKRIVENPGGKPGMAPALFHDFLAPALAAGLGVHAKNLYNLYVYFWRWALWKVFEHGAARESGVVSFISASSYLDGAAFCGMREHMRRVCDEIWILDLGGEGRGTRQNENVFAIRTPVAITIAVRSKKAKKEKPARVRYVRIEGTREEKLRRLDKIRRFRHVKWQECPGEWRAPFRPAGKGRYFSWPKFTDLMPWQHTGCEFKRTWPICHDPETLKERWRALLSTPDRATAFRETRDRKISTVCPPLFDTDSPPETLEKSARNAPAPRAERYAFRSFDRQWAFADTRLGDYLRPVLWRIFSRKQVYFSSSVVLEIGKGPALTASWLIPDRHYFAGRGGKDILPLYRDAAATQPNLFPCLLTTLGKLYKRKLTPEDMAAYFYGILAHPAFTERFAEELETRELRAPLTKNPRLFEKVRAAGARLLWLHTYGERFIPKGKRRGQIPRGAAKCVKAIPGAAEGYPEDFDYNETTRTLHVGAGEFAPVSRQVFEFEVSGLKVLQSWLKYRMKSGAGKKSSPLDAIRPRCWTSQFTTELLELLWVLEATLEMYPGQKALLEEVIAGECLLADEMPPLPEELRRAPCEPILQNAPGQSDWGEIVDA